MRKKCYKTQIANIRNERDNLTTKYTDIKWVREYYDPICHSKFSNLDEMGQFLGKLISSKLAQKLDSRTKVP